MKINKQELLAIITTLFCPPLGLFYILFTMRKKISSWRVFIVCISWSMAVFAYCYEPTTDSDLVRYFSYVEQLKGHTFDEAMSIGQYGRDGLYSFVFVCWLVTVLNDIRLLAAISVFCVYYIGLYVTCKVGEDLCAKSKDIYRYVLLLLMVMSFYSVVNNVRNVWAFSLVSFAIFRDCYEKKRNIVTLFLYVFPLFLHTSAIIFVILRLVLRLTGKIRTLCTTLVFLVPIALSVLSNILSGISSKNIIIKLLINMINSGNNYFVHTTSTWALTIQNSGAGRYARIVYISFAFVMTFLYFKIRKKLLNYTFEKVNNNQILALLDFSFLTALLTMSCVSMVMPEYWRFVSITILFSGCIYFCCVISLQNKELIRNGLMIFGPLCLVYWMRCLFLYSDIGLMVLRSFFANPFIIGILRMFDKSIELFS